MINDDGDVTDFHTWEINASAELISTENVQLEIPHIDLNYGVIRNVQLTAGMPLKFDIDHGQASGRLGSIYMGIKFRFIDESKHFVTAAIFPQLVTRSDNGYFVPVFIHKTVGSLELGGSVGYFFDKYHHDYFQWGGVAGYNISDRLQLMGEYFIQYNGDESGNSNAYVNMGFRQTINESLYLMGAAGRQIVTSPPSGRAALMLWIGVRILI